MRGLIGAWMLVVVFSAATAGVATAGDVGWRTDGTGRYPDAKPPTAFSPTENVVWAADLPAWSNASPVVLEDRIFVCAEPATVVAVDKKTGAILWQRSNPLAIPAMGEDGKPKIRTHPDNGYTSATITTDGRRLFAVFGTGVVAAYDLDGKPLWTRLLEPPAHPWGHGSSPLLVAGMLLVQIETLFALDPSDGSLLWTQPAERPASKKAKRWGTPAATRIGEMDVVVTIAGNAIRVADGQILFSGLGAPTFSSPLIVDGIVYTVSMGAARAVRLPASPEGKPEELWKTKTPKDRFYGSPLLHEGLLYTITRRGVFVAFDAKTGAEVFQQPLKLAKTAKTAINSAYTSATLGGESIYLAGMDGSIVVIKPGRTYEQVALNKVEDSLRSNPVFEGTRMYVRAPGKLYCFGR